MDDGWGQLLHRRRCQEYLSGGHPFSPPSPPLSRNVSLPSVSLPPRVPRFPRFPLPFTLSTPSNAFSFRVARRILLLRLPPPLLGGVR